MTVKYGVLEEQKKDDWKQQRCRCYGMQQVILRNKERSDKMWSQLGMRKLNNYTKGRETDCIHLQRIPSERDHKNHLHYQPVGICDPGRP
jgi:hypothetical protein